MAPSGAWFFGTLMLRLHNTTQDLQYALERDHLTGVYNRQFLVTCLDSIATEESAVILMADIDHFKKINDTHGHLAGDKVIQHVAECLADNCRSSDMVARFGGEEFAIVMKDTNPFFGNELAERIRKAVAEITVPSDGVPVSVTTSVGVASRKNGEDITKVLHAADVALYDAKASGRNQVRRAA
ncbi:MAG: GGDEF domain-containing protein [Shimia sp.]|uniref:GGDEF domain-containing protein n=1 Tax=Shimia sp. TaxID=1954381 RepID=UPI00405965DE